MDRIQNFLERAMEGMIFSERDKCINIDKWAPGKHNVLFITGLSGSGKSTTAAKIQSEKKGSINFELDNIEYHYDKSNTGIIAQLIKEFPEYAKLVADAERRAEETGRPTPCHFTGSQLLVRLYDRAIELMHQDSRHLYIAEGVQIYSFAEPNIAEEPLILIGGGAARSLMWRLRRTHSNDNGKIDWGAVLNDEPVELCHYYYDENKAYGKFKKSIAQ